MTNRTDRLAFYAAVLVIVATAMAMLSESCRAAELPQTVAWEASHHAVKVTAGTSAGSGVYLGDGLVLTAEHVVRGEGPRCWVSFPDPGKQGLAFAQDVPASVAKTDPQWDLCLLSLDKLPDHALPGVVVAGRNVEPMDKLVAAGYPGGQSLRICPGTVRLHVSAPGQGVSDWFEFSCHPTQGVRPGYSGGPVFLPDGRLAGIVWGGGDGTAEASSTARTHIFLASVRQRLKDWHARRRQQPAQWGGFCPPGYQCPIQQPQDSRNVFPGGRPSEIPPDVADPPLGSPAPQPLSPVPSPQPQVKGCECEPQKGCNCSLDAAMRKLQEALAAQVEAIAKQKPPAAPAEPPSPAEVDYDLIIAGVVAEIQGRPEFRGPKGDKGDPGRNGAAGSPAKQITLSEAEYERIALEVKKRLAGSLRVRVEPVSGSPAKRK